MPKEKVFAERGGDKTQGSLHRSRISPLFQYTRLKHTFERASNKEVTIRLLKKIIFKYMGHLNVLFYFDLVCIYCKPKYYSSEEYPFATPVKVMPSV